MLEVLDPEQNSTFRDNYLGVPFDLSRSGVHRHGQHARHHSRAFARPDGNHQLAGYTERRKIRDRAALSRRAPARGNGLKPEQVEIDDEALSRIIRDYTREAGRAQSGARDRRGLAPCRGEDRRGQRRRMSRIGADDLAAIWGRRASRTRWRCGPACRASRPASPGRRSAATYSSSRRPARRAAGRLILTGQLGEVMRESAQAALDPGQEPGGALGIDADTFREERHPYPCAGRRDAKRRPERRRRHVHRAGVAADATARCAATRR